MTRLPLLFLAPLFVVLFLSFRPPPSVAEDGGGPTSPNRRQRQQQFKEAPEFYNSLDCPAVDSDQILCSPEAVHVAMTLDTQYLRGSMAAILSILQHSACPENVAFYFVYSAATSNSTLHRSTIAASFPYLRFEVYPFDDSAVARLISTSIRSALDCPPQLRPQLPRPHPPALHCTRRPRVLQRQLRRLLHPDLLVKPFALVNVLRPEALLLQHRRHRHRPSTMARRRLHDQDRGVDGAPEADADLRARLPPAVLAGLRRQDRVCGPPLEPARPRRRQLPRALQGPPPWPRQSPPLERQGEAMGEAGCQPSLPTRRPVVAIRSPADSLLAGLLNNRRCSNPREIFSNSDHAPEENGKVNEFINILLGLLNGSNPIDTDSPMRILIHAHRIRFPVHLHLFEFDYIYNRLNIDKSTLIRMLTHLSHDFDLPLFEFRYT
ncbi:hypothetical protein SAY86_006507 [Trapa natans]|uniref:Hexosyltransferase n=1 Tax=Trapa natans TaxID=22666 RepID=A0AAN7L7H1_TRANT|nr:hypothetical protein SAY86_006507 [Trapa natans]